MSNENLTPSEIKKLAKKIISKNPIYILNEPTVVGSAKNLIKELNKAEDEEPSKAELKRS